jgi:quercetin dioxygenase-like cupin family protein
MKMTNVQKADDKLNPHGVSAKQIYDSPHVSVVHITLQPGQSLKRHVTPVDVFFYVLEGSGVVEIGEEKEKVSRDMIIESPARVPHALMNDGAEIFRVLVVKVPNPTEPTKVL